MQGSSVSRQGQPKRFQVKIKNQTQSNLQNGYLQGQGQSFSFIQKNINPKSSPRNANGVHYPKKFDSNFSLGHTDHWSDRKIGEEGSILLADLAKRLQKIAYAVLQAEYGSSFTQNSSHFEWIAHLKQEETVQKLLHSYSQMLLAIVQIEEQQRLQFLPRYKMVGLQKQQRTKLKLILTQTQQTEMNKFKSKGLQSYVKKVEDQCEKYKRENIRVKERNRILQSELLKLSLEFKNKRELYITEISRLTQILHSSFMEVGKMFITTPNQNTNYYPPPAVGLDSEYSKNYEDKSGQNYYRDLKSNQYNRKNVKSVSPGRKAYELGSKDQTKFTEFSRAQIKTMSEYEGDYVKPESSKGFRKNQEGFISERRASLHLEGLSEFAIDQKTKLDQKPFNFGTLTLNYNGSTRQQ